MTDPEHGASSDLRLVLDADGAFASSWLREKSVAPVPVGEQIDAALARRITAGCRAVGASHILATSLVGDSGATSRLPADADCTGIRPPLLLRTPDSQGAVLFPEAGYALIAGTTAFMAAAVSEGTDTARARFGRYARTLLERHPALASVAASHPPGHRAWSQPGDVAPASAAARQLALLDAFTDGTCDAPDFARGWWEARRASQANGERVQGALGDLLDQVFMILEDYSVDPDLAEPGDLDDAGLRIAVREAWQAFRHGET
ncbi:colicin immunity domain-containing protein [Streptomyces sp. NPDC005486]|uniref:colicin immunity domain-containing protein n=1 Tax=Streptomyces sp. NPDC005486 TaxID=3155345 RepID=UPI0033A6E775